MAELTIFGALQNAMTGQKALHPVPERGWHKVIHEPYTGAWQQNMEEKRGTILCYPTLYACLNRISQDVGKLPFLLKREDANGIWQIDRANTSFWPVLRKPNGYQTAQQFREAWIMSKLIHGNAYILKGRDHRDVVTRLYVLDPCRVMPMVSDSGDVFYQINYPQAENLLPSDYPNEQITVPAREIIHDRLNAFHHQLVGVPPLCAAYWPAVKNLKILKNAAEFFGNHAQPGGILTAPAGMTDDDAVKVKNFWDTNYSGDNRGKIAVLGADMKFTSFAVNSADSQLVEQMQYSDRQICQPFGIPPFIVGIGEIPAGMKTDDIANTYYQFALQAHIEAMEYLLDEGLKVERPMGVELDLAPLLRMDASKQAAFHKELVGASIETPNEARQQFGLQPLKGGSTVYMQQQNYSLEALAKRDAQEDPFGATAPTPPPGDEPDPELATANEENKRLRARLNTRDATDAMRSAAL